MENISKFGLLFRNRHHMPEKDNNIFMLFLSFPHEKWYVLFASDASHKHYTNRSVAQIGGQEADFEEAAWQLNSKEIEAQS